MRYLLNLNKLKIAVDLVWVLKTPFMRDFVHVSNIFVSLRSAYDIFVS